MRFEWIIAMFFKDKEAVYKALMFSSYCLDIIQASNFECFRINFDSIKQHNSSWKETNG
jgi:hypothetical protein